MISQIAPGSRIIAREEEWLVRRVDRTESGAQLVTVTGLSLRDIGPDRFSKYQQLLALIRGKGAQAIGWNQRREDYIQSPSFPGLERLAAPDLADFIKR